MPTPVHTLMNTPIPTLINVLGTSYSGTTMLDLMLGNGPDAFSCGEVHALFRPFRTSHRQLAGLLRGDDPSSPWARIGPVDEALFHVRVAEALGVEVVVDSSKDLVWLVDSHRWAARSGLRVANVVIWKYPVELAHSYHKRDLSFEESRHHFLTYHQRLLSTGVPLTTVRWRDLAASPASTLRALCELLGVPWREGRERFWEAEATHLFGNAGTRAQADAGASTFRAPSAPPREVLEPFARFSAASRYEEAAKPIIDRLLEFDILQGKPSQPALPVVPRKGTWYYRQSMARAWRKAVPEKR